MDKENELYQEEIREDDIEVMLPDGYADGDDFFNPDAWTGENSTDSASDDSTEPAEGEPREDSETETDPAIGQESEETLTDADDAPATGNTEPSSKRRVRYQFDHQDVEEDIDLDTDLPEILQKARSVDRYKDRLSGVQSLKDRVEATAKAFKYDSADAFLDAILDNAKTNEMDSLKGRGVPDEIAEDYVSRKYSGVAPAQPTQPNPAPEQGSSPDGRDFVAEARELLTVHPELRGKDLPPEVYAAVTEPGKTLLTAYTEYERKVSQAEAEKARTETEKLRKENRILKNNADSADRAPVSGVSKGGKTDSKGQDDPFLKGFDSV